MMEQERPIDGYQKLAGAITVQAVEDFRKSLRHLARGKGNLDLDIREISDVIRFVNSKWFTTLISVDPNIVIKRLQEELEQSGIEKVLGDERYNQLTSGFNKKGVVEI